MTETPDICCLCNNPATEDDPITREHVPPKQFYPKSERTGLNLWTVPTHRSCNSSHKLDEEYFYHALFPLVVNANPQMSSVMLDDLKRRARKPQTQVLMRKILSTRRYTGNRGIVLPPGIVSLDIDTYRVQQVAIKVGRCLFYRDQGRYMPLENCKDIQFCEREEDIPELYRLSWDISKVNVLDLPETKPGGIVVAANDEGQPSAVCHQIFSYRSAHIEEFQLLLYTMMFWEAFAFCIAFDDP